MSVDFHLLAFELLGIVGLPLPRMDGHEGDTYLTSQQYHELGLIVCENVPSVTLDHWDESTEDERAVWLRHARRKLEASVEPDLDDAFVNQSSLSWYDSRFDSPEAKTDKARLMAVSRFLKKHPEIRRKGKLVHAGDWTRCKEAPDKKTVEADKEDDEPQETPESVKALLRKADEDKRRGRDDLR